MLDHEIFLTFLLGLNIIDWISILLVIVFQTMLFSIGIQSNKKLINYSAIIVYAGMIIFFLTVFLSDVKTTTQAFSNILNFENFLKQNNILPLITVAGTIFAYFSIVIVSFGDFTRYVNNKRDLTKGNLSLILNLIIFSFFSIAIVVGSDVFLNKKFQDFDRIFTNPIDIIGKFTNLQITIAVMVIIIIGLQDTK